MPNLTAPAVPSANGVSNDNMADVIDSLKRLERIGDEQSKTVEKILQAARELEHMITSQYGAGALPRQIRGASVFKNIPDVMTGAVLDLNKADKYAQSLGIRRVSSMNYDLSAYTICPRGEQTRVSENREFALAFSRHVADGFLLLIEQDLKKMQAENEGALHFLQSARKSEPNQ